MVDFSKLESELERMDKDRKYINELLRTGRKIEFDKRPEGMLKFYKQLLQASVSVNVYLVDLVSLRAELFELTKGADSDQLRIVRKIRSQIEELLPIYKTVSYNLNMLISGFRDYLKFKFGPSYYLGKEGEVYS